MAGQVIDVPVSGASIVMPVGSAPGASIVMMAVIRVRHRRRGRTEDVRQRSGNALKRHHHQQREDQELSGGFEHGRDSRLNGVAFARADWATAVTEDSSLTFFGDPGTTDSQIVIPKRARTGTATAEYISGGVGTPCGWCLSLQRVPAGPPHTSTASIKAGHWIAGYARAGEALIGVTTVPPGRRTRSSLAVVLSRMRSRFERS